MFLRKIFFQGPFKLDGDSYVYIKKEDNVNYPLSLYLKKNKTIYKIDSYEENCDSPNIDSVFFLRVNKIKDVVVLVSWRQEHRAEKIRGRYYKVFGYFYDGKTLISNSEITEDSNLSGEDGEYYGDEFHFKYKSANLIKEYLKEKAKG